MLKPFVFLIQLVIFLAVYTKVSCNLSSLTSKQICTLLLKEKVGEHYTLIKIKCHWHQYVNYIYTEAASQQKPSNEELILYEIEFVEGPKVMKSEIDFSTITPKFFQNFFIRKLSIHDVNLKSIQVGSFDSCCSKYLEELDLSNNNLKYLNKDAVSVLKSLKKLNLENNALRLEDDNFAAMTHMEEINLAGNELHFLSAKALSNLPSLKKIDLRNNGLTKIDTCSFNAIIKNKYLQLIKLYEVDVNLLNNSIDCNCDVFYLDRKTNIKLNAVCGAEPSYYKGKMVAELSKENPENVHCYYRDIEERCEAAYADPLALLRNNSGYKVATLCLAILILILNMAILCVCCRLSSINEELKLKSKKLNQKNNSGKKYNHLNNIEE